MKTLYFLLAMLFLSNLISRIYFIDFFMKRKKSAKAD